MNKKEAENLAATDANLRRGLTLMQSLARVHMHETYCHPEVVTQLSTAIDWIEQQITNRSAR